MVSPTGFEPVTFSHIFHCSALMYFRGGGYYKVPLFSFSVNGCVIAYKWRIYAFSSFEGDL